MMQMQGGSFCVKKFDEKIFPPLEIQVILDLKCIFCVIIFFSLIVTKTTFFFKKYIADAVQIFSKFYGKVGLILVTFPFHKIFFVLLRFRLENLKYHKTTTTYFFFFIESVSDVVLKDLDCLLVSPVTNVWDWKSS